VAGDLLPTTDAFGNTIGGSWLCAINSDGKLSQSQTLPDTVINALVAAQDGCYAIGEDDSSGTAHGLVIKYDAQGKVQWKKNDLPGQSYYQCAILAEDGSLVLGGTAWAQKPDGTGGTPVIEALDPATGHERWLSKLSGIPGAALVSSLTQAPGYGYFAALEGVSNSKAVSPFILARLNARGLVWHLMIDQNNNKDGKN
jgi:hypothetical protein